jgi:uncharacterized protein (TIGR02271 family)
MRRRPQAAVRDRPARSELRLAPHIHDEGATMNWQMTMDRLAELHGSPVFDESGEKIGKVEEIYYDEASNRAEWIGIGTGFLGTKRVLVPVEGAQAGDESVTVPYAKDMVKDSPDIDSDPIDADSEQALHAYYGTTHRGYSDATDSSARSTDHQTGLDNVDEKAVTRSEEELRVGKRSVDAGSVRLRKWVETEPVQASINLTRETVHVNREPIGEVVTGAEIGEQTIEIPLRDEEAVVDKQIIAKERVSLDKDVEERTETVDGEIRKERVEIEGADDPGSPDR